MIVPLEKDTEGAVKMKRMIERRKEEGLVKVGER
jgi:hypothetical protein